VDYCIDRTFPDLPAEPDEPVIFYFHGIMSNHLQWVQNFSEVFHDVAKESAAWTGKRSALTVVAFNTDMDSFFADRKGVPHGPRAYRTWFLKEFFPKMIQERGLCARRDCRAIAGYSMGGHGAASIAFEHPELFSSIALSAPAMSAHSPFLDDHWWWNYFARHPVDPLLGFPILWMVRDTFGSEDYFERVNPMRMAENFADPAAFPRLYMEAGEADFYGFNEGVVALSAALDYKGIPYDAFLEPQTGHDIWKRTNKRIVKFLWKQLLPTAALPE
jgi:S-formylglutathione hydrolase FrmB